MSKSSLVNFTPKMLVLGDVEAFRYIPGRLGYCFRELTDQVGSSKEYARVYTQARSLTLQTQQVI